MSDAAPGVGSAGWAKEGTASIERMGIEAVPDSERYGKVGRLFTVWFAPQVTPVTFFLGALGPSFGLGFVPSLLAILLGNAVGAMAVAWLSTWGPKSGMAQMVLSRAAFGKSMRGVSMVNWLTTLGWQAFDNVFGATALKLLLGIPFWAGVLLVLAAQVTISVLGYEAVHKFQHVMTFVLAIVFLYVTVRIITTYGTTNIASTVHGANLWGAFFLMIAAVLGYMFTWSPYAADYSRYLPANSAQGRVFAATWLGLMASTVWMEVLGLSVAHRILGEGLTGTAATIRHIMGGGALGVIGLIAIYLGIVAVNTIDDYSASLSMLAAGIRLIRPLAALISDGTAFGLSMIFIYAAAGLPAKAENFLLFISYWVSAWVGVVAVDWVRRRGRVNTAAIQSDAQLPVGVPALIAFLVGFVSALPFSDTTIGYNFVVGHPHSWIRYLLGQFSISTLHGADVGFFISFVVSVTIYVLLTHRQGEVPYLPRITANVTQMPLLAD